MFKKSSWNYRRIHNSLLWLGGISLLLFVISGITHPLLTWFGPQPATMQPLRLNLQPSELVQAQQIAANQKEAALIRLVPFQRETVLQLTTTTTEPRRYLTLNGGHEIANADARLAEALARHYNAATDEQVSSVLFQTEFDAAYPSVNRLLPVYRVEFASGLISWIHTETLSQASLSNQTKTAMQQLFRQLHSWQWLEPWPLLRLSLMLLMLGSALLLVFSGFMLFRRQPVPKMPLRRLHVLLGSVLAVPLALYIITGSYHLIDQQLKTPQLGLTLPPVKPLAQMQGQHALPEALQHQQLQGASLIQDAAGHWYWRLSGSNAAQQSDRNSRFSGQSRELHHWYLPTSPAQPELNDKKYATQLAQQFVPALAQQQPEQLELVTHFGADYDFRNKRLPVWRLDFGGAHATTLFIDTASGVLVEQLSRQDRFERYSFSFIHKWNLLQPVLGRAGRDAMVVAVMALVLVLAGLGMALRWRKNAARR